jgi:glutamine---fructose-6-phosphate transaminase (isomerizing)
LPAQDGGVMVPPAGSNAILRLSGAPARSGPVTSLMLQEACEAPARVAAMLARDGASYDALAAMLAKRPPAFAATIARGSSDHAATYAASLLGIAAGLATASIPPSLVTRYRVALDLGQALVLAISQSGASPDLIATLQAASVSGACTVAIVNVPGAPLARVAGHALAQQAGPERSVAATKSFICSLACSARLIARWRADPALAAALERLPDRLERALDCDWSGALEMLAPAGSLYVVGRGLGFGIVHEWALKLKETSGLHAEALSAIEVEHGPRAVIDQDFPVLALALDDPAGRDAAAFAAGLAERGHKVAVASAAPVAGRHLPLPPPLHPLLDPIVAVQAFYPLAAMLAEARGLDPDRPRGLSKVTTTI